MENPKFKQSLAQFYGTEQYFYNKLYAWLRYTDGVKFFAENAGGGAYWFLDIIGTELLALADAEEFLSIRLSVKGSAAVITVTDGRSKKPKYLREIDFTDCPEGEYAFYLENRVMMLTGER